MEREARGFFGASIDSKVMREMIAQIDCAAQPVVEVVNEQNVPVQVLAAIAAQKLAEKWGCKIGRT